MKCKACDVALSDQESTRKYTGTDEYADLCNKCYYASEAEELELPVEAVQFGGEL